VCCSDGTSVEENTVKLMKVASVTLPLGVFITVVACFFVFWWQELSYTNPYAQAILINGKVSAPTFNFSNSMFLL
jgi:oligosaccharide translocation protein RFT1